MKMKYRKSVFIVSYRFENNKLKYLILKRHLHWNGWEFPKGGIEGKESAIQIVKREIKEETDRLLKTLNPIHFRVNTNTRKYCKIDRA